ncbi:MAG TPA: Ig-like domain-containing protein, partial [Thermoleophilia bacterium]|nr:Ig-like domain-containing protein [Thermoleophilia bacterium]
ADPLIGITVNGTLIANGTESENVTFTSNEASPRAGDWNRIDFGTAAEAGSVIDNCVIEYAKVGVNVVWTTITEAKPCPVSVTDNTLRNISNRGVQIAGWKASSGTPRDYHPIIGIVIRGNTFMNVGQGTAGDPMAIYTVSVKDVEVSGNRIQGGEGGYLAYLGVAFENYTFADNIIQDPGYQQGVYISTTAGHPQILRNEFIGEATATKFRCVFAYGHTGLTIKDNKFKTGSSGIYIVWWVNSPNVVQVIIEGNTLDGVGTGGSDSYAIVDDSLWNTPRPPSEGWDVRSWVRDGVIRDNVIRNTNGVGISIPRGSYTYPEYGTVDLGDVLIQDNVITNNTVGIQVGLTGGDDAAQYGIEGIEAHSNEIVGNGIGVKNISMSEDVFDATNNWWGDASGPTHAGNPAGRGDAVSDNVQYSPWLGASTEADTLPPLVAVITPAEDPAEPVSQAFSDEEGAPLATVTFPSVTAAGTVTFTAVEPEDVGGTDYPAADGFWLGDPPVYVDITADEALQFETPVKVCLNYEPESFPAGTPRLFHYEDGEWVDVTTSTDTTNHVVCGEVSSLSPFAVGVDDVHPAVTVAKASGQADPTNRSPISFTVTFSEPVAGFAKDDVQVETGAGTAFSAAYESAVTVEDAPGGTYTVKVAGMDCDGRVAITILGGAVYDAAGNRNSVSEQVSVTYDATAPTVTINQAPGQADPTNRSPISFTVTFSEPVTGFTSEDVTLSGAAGAGTVVVAGSGATYTVAVSGMTRQGTVVASLPAGAAQDAAGNPSLASTSTDNEVTYITVRQWQVTLSLVPTGEVRPGTPVTFGGTAKLADGTPARGTVTIEKRRQGSEEWLAWRTATLDAEGSYAVTVEMTTANRVWEFRTRVAGDAALAIEESYSPVAELTVLSSVTKPKWQVSLVLSAHKVKPGATVTYRGTVKTAEGKAGKGTVIIQKRRQGTSQWQTWRKPVLKSGGRYVVSVKMTTANRVWQFRAKMPANAANATAYSATKVLTVTRR